MSDLSIRIAHDDTTRAIADTMLERTVAALITTTKGQVVNAANALRKDGGFDPFEAVAVVSDGSDRAGGKPYGNCIRSNAARAFALGEPFHDPNSLHPASTGVRGGACPQLAGYFPGGTSTLRVLVNLERKWFLLRLEQGVLESWMAPPPAAPLAKRSA